MGETINRPTTTDTRQEGSRGGENGHSPTASTNSRGGRGRGRTGTKGDKQNEVIPKLATVKEPKKVEVAIPVKEQPEQKTSKRGRPSGTTKKRTATKKAVKMDSKQIATLLCVTSGILASREGFEIFALTEQEAEQIATPLTNILAKNEALANAAGEHADAITLLIAVATIMIPKFLLWQAMRPKKPKQTKLEVTQNAQLETRTSATDNQHNHQEGGAADNRHDDGTTFSGSINEFLAPVI